jgi:hypothetical protein
VEIPIFVGGMKVQMIAVTHRSYFYQPLKVKPRNVYLIAAALKVNANPLQMPYSGISNFCWHTFSFIIYVTMIIIEEYIKDLVLNLCFLILFITFCSRQTFVILKIG